MITFTNVQKEICRLQDLIFYFRSRWFTRQRQKKCQPSETMGASTRGRSRALRHLQGPGVKLCYQRGLACSRSLSRGNPVRNAAASSLTGKVRACTPGGVSSVGRYRFTSKVGVCTSKDTLEQFTDRELFVSSE